MFLDFSNAKLALEIIGEDLLILNYLKQWIIQKLAYLMLILEKPLFLLVLLLIVL